MGVIKNTAYPLRTKKKQIALTQCRGDENANNRFTNAGTARYLMEELCCLAVLNRVSVMI
jgi:hypothetical protein